MYKKKEFNLRNVVNFDKIDFSNFIKFSDDLIIDYENNNGEFEKSYLKIYPKEMILRRKPKGHQR